MNDERTSETPEPSAQSMRAAKQIGEWCIIGLDSEFEDAKAAEIIDRETGSGEAVAVIKDLMGQWSPLAPEYDRARAFLARFNR